MFFIQAKCPLWKKIVMKIVIHLKDWYAVIKHDVNKKILTTWGEACVLIIHRKKDSKLSSYNITAKIKITY